MFKRLAPLLLILLLSCNQKKDKSLVKVEVDKFTSEQSFEDFASETSFLKLESTEGILIAEVTKLFISDSLIFIFDKRQSKVFSFDMEGSFRFLIDQPSEENGIKFEYIRDIFYDKQTKLLHVVDQNANKIYAFNQSGTLEKTVSPSVRASSIYRTNSGNWAINNAWAGSPDYPKKIYLLDSSFSKTLNSGGNELPFGNITVPNPFISFNNTTRFIHGFDTKVYSVYNDEITTSYTIDFGKYNVTNELLSQPRKLLMSRFLKGEYAGIITNYVENKKVIAFAYTKGTSIAEQKRSRYFVYDKKKNAPLYHFRNLHSESQNIPIAYPSFNLKNQFVSVIDYYGLHPSTGTQPKGIGQLSSQFGWFNSWQEVKAITKESDSPILVFYEIKANP